jgi:hypothetical protein
MENKRIRQITEAIHGERAFVYTVDKKEFTY